MAGRLGLLMAMSEPSLVALVLLTGKAALVSSVPWETDLVALLPLAAGLGKVQKRALNCAKTAYLATSA